MDSSEVARHPVATKSPQKVVRLCPITPRGPCTAPMLKDGSGYCVFHHPGEEHRKKGYEVRSQAARNINRKMHPPLVLKAGDLPELDPSDGESVLQYQLALMDALAQGRIDPNRARVLMEAAAKVRASWIDANETSSKADAIEWLSVEFSKKLGSV